MGMRLVNKCKMSKRWPFEFSLGCRDGPAANLFQTVASWSRSPEIQGGDVHDVMSRSTCSNFRMLSYLDLDSVLRRNVQLIMLYVFVDS
jgi:hypothetical protein